MTDYISREAALKIIDPGHGDFHAGNYNAIAALPGIPAPHLCEDEGCPHYGTPHVCISRPMPDAEPVAYLSRTALSREVMLCAKSFEGGDTWAHSWSPAFPVYEAPPSVVDLQAEVDRQASLIIAMNSAHLDYKRDTEAALTEERAHAERLAEAAIRLNNACDNMWNDHMRLEPNRVGFGQQMKLKEVHFLAITEAQQQLPAILEALAAHEARKGG